MSLFEDPETPLQKFLYPPLPCTSDIHLYNAISTLELDKHKYCIINPERMRSTMPSNHPAWSHTCSNILLEGASWHFLQKEIEIRPNVGSTENELPVRQEDLWQETGFVSGSSGGLLLPGAMYRIIAVYSHLIGTNCHLKRAPHKVIKHRSNYQSV